MGHSGVQGNEKVDEEAKRAVQGESSPPHRLPLILQEELPKSIVAVKQKLQKELKERWKEMWEASPQFAKLSWIDPSFSYKQYAEIQSNLHR